MDTKENFIRDMVESNFMPNYVEGSKFYNLLIHLYGEANVLNGSISDKQIDKALKNYKTY
jgi:hypothetical protein